MNAAQKALEFDAETHTYRIFGRVVPSVTQIIKAVVGSEFWFCTEWHLRRGRAIHAAAAMIARGQPFTAEPRLDGYCKAIRAFLDHYTVEFLEVERTMYSEQYQFAGTLDIKAVLAHGKHKGKTAIIDYKHTLSGTTGVQIGGYSILDGKGVNTGLGVELHDNGGYKVETYDLTRARNEFTACRMVYNLKRKCGLVREEEDSENEGGP